MADPEHSITCHIIPHGGNAYQQALRIRQSLLRDPQGLKYTEEELAPEKDDTHLAVMKGDKLIAYLFLRPENPTTVKLRQVVVDSSVQGKGIGTRLIRFAEQVAKEKGFTHAALHAREAAIPFYEKMGFVKEGEAVELVKLPHWYMCKSL